jgi:hypothetical protein
MVSVEEGSTVTAKMIDLGLAKPAADALVEAAISTPVPGLCLALSMTVKNGILHGERGNRGMGDFYEINGTTAADGTATIRADGITGKGTEFTKGHRSPGTPFSYAVIAQFEDRHGTGKSIGDPRIRIFTFVKD